MEKKPLFMTTQLLTSVLVRHEPVARPLVARQRRRHSDPPTRDPGARLNILLKFGTKIHALSRKLAHKVPR